MGVMEGSPGGIWGGGSLEGLRGGLWAPMWVWGLWGGSGESPNVGLGVYGEVPMWVWGPWGDYRRFCGPQYGSGGAIGVSVGPNVGVGSVGGSGGALRGPNVGVGSV